ncbi:MAG: MBL fold metallo-hydrolase [Thermoplasmata archaeon]
MSEILPGIHQIERIDPSPQFTTHVYLMKNPGAGWSLIDGGLPGAETAILAHLDRLGAAPHDISSILVTHLHNDHTGALRRLRELTGATIYAHWLEADFIAGRPRYDGKGVPPENPLEVDVKIKDGDRLDAAGGLVAHHTPGHTPGHTAFYLPERRILFSGDLFFGVPDLALTTPEYTHHQQSAQISARRMNELQPESILSYHGGPFLHGAAARLDRLVRDF